MSNIVSTVLTDPIRVVQRYGGDVSCLCRQAGIASPPESNATISLRTFVHFSQLAAQALGNDELGWEIGSEFDLCNIGAVGRFALEAPTLGAALSLLTRSFAMVQSDSMLDLKIEGDKAVLRYRILDLSIWPRNQDAELSIAVFLNLLKRAAGADWRPERISFEHAATPIWKNNRSGPRCSVEYLAAENSIMFPANLLTRKLPASENHHFTTLSRALNDESRKLERDAPISIQVRREILKRFGQGEIGQTEIARTLGYSRRTLRRRLESEETSFSAILMECRIRRAENMLTLPGVPLALIADHLGYADTSPFERAFRTIKGQTPAQFRKTALFVSSTD